MYQVLKENVNIVNQEIWKIYINQIEFLEVKNIIFEIKNSLDGHNHRLYNSEENISELEEVATKTIQNESRKKKRLIKI